MAEYRPDKWVVIKISGVSTPVYKVFACWYGGYAGSDSWKLNSGITKATLEGYVYSFEGSSGSVYQCHKDCYGTNSYGYGVLMNMIETAKKRDQDLGLKEIDIEIVPEETNWLEINYE
ncbi:hypothetical protein UFOVP240_20 [uncultured Caudovirales phage]|uniref:Uncharacterized protein n=1 Tax=uncultured Caudovirales phage TaxID=2100421 RepID=A0A6J7WRV4_9CAUD|nr:hypothetical protein UFOVP240_20 [uncultured Caudovirales phage]